MASTAELRGRVSLDTSRFESGLRKLRNAARAAAREYGQDFRDLGMGLAKSAALVAGAALGGVVLAAKVAADYGDAMMKASQRTGIATDTLSALKLGADLADVSMEGLEKSIAFMSRTVADARTKNQAAEDALASVGVRVKDLANLSPDQIFLKLGNAVGSISDPTRRGAAAVAIFGKEGRQLLPFLADGPVGLKKLKDEAARLGVLVTHEQAEKAADFNDAITRLVTSFRGLALAAVSLDPLRQAIDLATEAVVQFRQSGKFAVFTTNLGNFIRTAVENLYRLITAFGNMSTAGRDHLLNLLKIGGVFALGWSTGVVQSVLKITARLVAGMVALLSPQVLLGGLIATLGFLGGLSLGEALERTFNLSGLLLKTTAFLNGMWQAWNAFFSNLGAAAVVFGQQLAAAITPGQHANFSGAFASLASQFNHEMDAIADDVARRWKEVDAASAEGAAGNGKGFLQNLQEGQDDIARKIRDTMRELRDRAGQGLDDWLGNPMAGLGEFLAEFEKLSGLKLPAPVELAKDMGEADDEAKDLRRNLEAIRVPNRGFALDLPGDIAKGRAPLVDGGPHRPGAPLALATSRLRPGGLATTVPAGDTARPQDSALSVAGQLAELVKLATLGNQYLSTIAAKQVGTW